ncbi:MAG: M18 family aminopeptidase [Lachnospiraceae bacterium]|nr:M18 family aminopeptidase [Lachnospiraceae bacterium]
MDHLMNLLREGVTAAHTIAYMKERFINEGFEELETDQQWELKAGGRYYVNLYETNGIAFRVGEQIQKGQSLKFRIAMAHSDYPCFQIKPKPDIASGNVMKMNVDIYGGMYQKSWMDRPLGIAGRLVVKGEEVFAPTTIRYRSDRPLCIIPSLAIHMDRELNAKGALDTAKELVPLESLTKGDSLLSYIAKDVGISQEDILDFDLYTFVMDEPVLVGLDQAMLSSPRLDNLTSVAALQEGLLGCCQVPENTVDMMVVFDNEEVGSRTKQGADSELLSWIVQKIGMQWNDWFCKCDRMNKNFLLSVDVAHANHPNYPEKSDVTNMVNLGQGICVKRSIGQKYGTTAKTGAVIRAICEQKKIPYTIAVNRTGIPGGSTLGPIVSAHLPYPCADIGMPILSMHSACELGAMADYVALVNFMKAFYEI